MGASIVCGPGSYEGYEEERLADLRILALAEKIAGLLAALDDAPEVDLLTDGVWSLEESDGLARLTALLAEPASAWDG
jgi:hypothetical protein